MKKKALAVMAAFMLLFAACSPAMPPEKIEYTLKRTGRLETYSYTYRDIIYISDPNILAHIFNTDKPLLFSMDFTVRAGISMQNLHAKKDGLFPGSIELTIPQAKILSLDADEESIEEYFGSKNSYSLSKITEEIIKRKQDVEKAAISAGILQKAQKNAEEILRAWLREQGYTDITIVTEKELRG